MSSSVKRVEAIGGGRYSFHCPGCKYGHSFQVSPAGPPTWEWNGSVEYPTVTPSILVNGDGPTWTDDGITYGRCHSYITNGKIQFLDDCWHSLKGHTVSLDEIRG